MSMQSYFPGPPLSGFIEQFWEFEGEPVTHRRERLLPDGSMELVINLREDELCVYDGEGSGVERHSGAIVCGARYESMIIDTASQASVLGVHFRPGGAFPFLGLPADELCNTTLSLGDLWGSEAGRTRERLLEAGTNGLRFRILEDILLASAKAPLRRHGAVAWALGEFQLPGCSRPVSEVADATGFSSRRFIELFGQEVGLTPKRYCRVRRFQEAVRRIAREGEPPGADLAVSCGYYDQAHFIHDFRAFCGLTPGEYFARRPQRHPNHVPLTD